MPEKNYLNIEVTDGELQYLAGKNEEGQEFIISPMQNGNYEYEYEIKGSNDKTFWIKEEVTLE